MEESKLWQFKHQIKEEVKDLLNDDECWEMMAMLYLIMQEELFVTLLKYSKYQCFADGRTSGGIINKFNHRCLNN